MSKWVKYGFGSNSKTELHDKGEKLKDQKHIGHYRVVKLEGGKYKYGLEVLKRIGRPVKRKFGR